MCIEAPDGFRPPSPVIITVMFVIRFLIFITDRHSRSLVNVSAALHRLFQLIRPLHLSPFLLNLTLRYERSAEQTFLRKTARGLEGGTGEVGLREEKRDGSVKFGGEGGSGNASQKRRHTICVSV